MHAPSDILDVTVEHTSLAEIAQARTALAECPWELFPADREAYIEHLDMVESAIRHLLATL